jgi:hypothetical protein
MSEKKECEGGGTIFGPLSLSQYDRRGCASNKDCSNKWFQILKEGFIHDLKNKLRSKITGRVSG